MNPVIAEIQKVIQQYLDGAITDSECLMKIIALGHDWLIEVMEK